MCIILDANCYGDFSNRHEDMKPVHNWLAKGGKLVYSATEKFRQETQGRAEKLMYELDRAGKLRRIAPNRVEEKQETLPNLTSDDPHIIALALVANVKVLVSRDRNLQQDFTRIAKGKIYQKASHAHLLRTDTCH